MRRHAALGLSFLITLLLSVLSLFAQERELAIRGAEIHTVSSGIIYQGAILIQNGKIRAIGRSLTIPSGARIIDVPDAIVTPGIIDARSMVGIDPPDRWENSHPVVPQLRIIESFSTPRDHDWLRAGVTATYLTPGPQNVIGGMGAVVKLAGRPGEALVNDAAGMSVSLGEIPKRSFGDKAPRSRMGAVYLLRDTLLRAREYLNSGMQTRRDLGLEALGRVLRKEVPLRVQANTPDDILSAVRVGKEFQVRVVIDVGVGAHRVADKLAEAGVPVVVGPNMIAAGGGGRYEFALHTEENAARLHRAGVKIALGTDDDGGRSVVLEAAVSRAHGLPEAEALKAVTLNAAEILGVADRLGSLEPGKDADLVIWKHHPLSTWGEAQVVIVNGRIVYERKPAGRES